MGNTIRYRFILPLGLTHWDQDKKDNILKCIFLNEDVRISINVSPTFLPKGPINNIRALIKKMAWRRPGDKSLSEPRLVSLLTHICITRPQWVKRDHAIAATGRDNGLSLCRCQIMMMMTMMMMIMVMMMMFMMMIIVSVITSSYHIIIIKNASLTLIRRKHNIHFIHLQMRNVGKCLYFDYYLI